nr:transcription factor SPEECHLESS-like [Lolium perenne]
MSVVYYKIVLGKDYTLHRYLCHFVSSHDHLPKANGRTLAPCLKEAKLCLANIPLAHNILPHTTPLAASKHKVVSLHTCKASIMGDALCDQLLVDVDGEFQLPSDADDLFRILETWEDCVNGPAAALSPTTGGHGRGGPGLLQAGPAPGNKGSKRRAPQDEYDGTAKTQKRQRYSPEEGGGATPKTPHITVERNRRKQMNEHLTVLRSLMPCFYVKRGDQASIIGGVVDYIKELQQVKQSLEAKKQRKVYTEHVLSPRPLPSSYSPRLPLSPLHRSTPPLSPLLKSTPPLSPRLAIPISPARTPPTPGSPYILRPLPPPLISGSTYVSPAMTPTGHDPAASSYLPSLDAITAELSVYANRQALLLPPTNPLPDVRVEFAGANLVLKTVSHRAPGQAVKIIAALEGRAPALEILHAKISTIDDTDVNAFTVKIGIECALSAEELVQEIQQTFS